MSRDLTVRVPGRGYVRLHLHHIDDGEGRKTPVGRWYVYATTQPGRDEPATSKEEAASRFHGTVLKGWYRIGPSRWSRHVEAEVAVGGEDSMVQVLLNASVLGTFALGVGVPRRWLDPWVYNRRVLLGVKVGYVGHPLIVDVMHDEQAGDMQGYYREHPSDTIRNGKPFPSELSLRKGIHREVGGAFFVEHQVVDRLFGKTVHTLVEGEPVTIVFQMPGSATEFEAVVNRERRTWKRPRAWWSKTADRYNVEVPQPPQFAGKGENSWDCGDDGIYGMTVAAATPEAAVQGYVKHVMDETAKRGPASDGARR